MIRAALEYLVDLVRPVAHEIKHQNGSRTVIHPEGHVVTFLDGDTRGERLHRFADVDSLAAWLNRHADPKLCEVLVDDSEVVAGLDPLWPGRACVKADLTPHPRATSWRSILGKGLSQRDLYTHLVASAADFDDHVVQVSGKAQNLGSLGLIIADELSKFRAVVRGEYEAVLDPRGYFQVRGSSDTTEVTGKIPSTFTVEVPWFLGVQLHPTSIAPDEAWEPIEATYRLELRLAVDVAPGRPPVFQVTCPSLKLVEHQARQDLVKHLDNMLDDGFLVSVGEYQVSDIVPEAVEPARGGA